MDKNLLTTVTIISSLALVSCADKKQDVSQHPNLVFIMADQWRGEAIGYLGIEKVQTPHLDQLAKSGIHFVDAVSSYPVSSPARGMLMSGMYPTKNGVTWNCNSTSSDYSVELKEGTRCWSDVLSDKGYDLGYIGKWHLDAPLTPYIDTHNNRGEVAWNEWCPPERRHGFKYWIAYGTYDNHLKPMYWDTHATRDDFYYVDQWGPEYETDKAIEYMEQRDTEKPFALVVSINPPHTGYDLVPDKYKEIYKNIDVESLCNKPSIPPAGTKEGDLFRNSILDYYACMSGVDEQVGRIVNTLKEQNLYENTIIVFTSDHGDQMGMHGHIGKNIYYEESMKVPMIMTWGSKLVERQDSLMIAFADLYPTLLSMMGFRNDIPVEVQTFDLSEVILNNNSSQVDIVQPYYYVDFRDNNNGMRGLRTSQFTYVVEAKDKKIEKTYLFDRKADPFQLQNIAEMNADVVDELKLKLVEWLTSTEDPFVVNLK